MTRTLTTADLLRLRDILNEVGLGPSLITELSWRQECINILHAYSTKGDLDPAQKVLEGAGYTVGVTINPDDYTEMMLKVTPPAPTHSTAQVDSILPTD